MIEIILNSIFCDLFDGLVAVLQKGDNITVIGILSFGTVGF